MKLADALEQKINLLAYIRNLGYEFDHSIDVQEGTVPTENPYSLLEQIYAYADEFKDISQKINDANMQMLNNQNRCVADILIDLEVTEKIYEIFEDSTYDFFENQIRYSKDEVKKVRTVPITYVREKLDALEAKKLELKKELLEANWKTDIE